MSSRSNGFFPGSRTAKWVFDPTSYIPRHPVIPGEDRCLNPPNSHLLRRRRFFQGSKCIFTRYLEDFIPGTPRPTIYKWLAINGWWIQSLQRKWLEITKHLFINGCLGFQVFLYICKTSTLLKSRFEVFANSLLSPKNARWLGRIDDRRILCIVGLHIDGFQCSRFWKYKLFLFPWKSKTIKIIVPWNCWL